MRILDLGGQVSVADIATKLMEGVRYSNTYVGINASLEVQYVATKRNGNLLVASDIGPNAFPTELPPDHLNHHNDTRYPRLTVPVDPFSAIAWGWMKVEDAPLPAGLHTFLTMTQNEQADKVLRDGQVR